MNSRGHVVQNYQPEDQGVSDEEIEAEIDEDYDSEDSDEYEYEYDEDGEEDSNDSEFTDLDNDSLVGSSLILDSTYNDNGGDSFHLFEQVMFRNLIHRKAERRRKLIHLINTQYQKVTPLLDKGHLLLVIASHI